MIGRGSKIGQPKKQGCPISQWKGLKPAVTWPGGSISTHMGLSFFGGTPLWVFPSKTKRTPTFQGGRENNQNYMLQRSLKKTCWPDTCRQGMTFRVGRSTVFGDYRKENQLGDDFSTGDSMSHSLPIEPSSSREARGTYLEKKRRDAHFGVSEGKPILVFLRANPLIPCLYQQEHQDPKGRVSETPMSDLTSRMEPGSGEKMQHII